MFFSSTQNNSYKIWSSWFLAQEINVKPGYTLGNSTERITPTSRTVTGPTKVRFSTRAHQSVHPINQCDHSSTRTLCNYYIIRIERAATARYGNQPKQHSFVRSTYCIGQNDFRIKSLKGIFSVFSRGFFSYFIK